MAGTAQPAGSSHGLLQDEPLVHEAQRQTVAQLQAVWEKVSALSLRLLKAASAPPGSKDSWSPEASADVLAQCDHLGHLLVLAGDTAHQRALEIAAAAAVNAAASSAVPLPLPDVEDIKEALWGPISCEAVLLALSDVYTTRRILDAAGCASKEQQGAVEQQQAWTAPDSFKRATTKYLVKSEHTLRVMTRVAKHLPLLVYGRKEGGPLAAAVVAATSKDASSCMQPEQLKAAFLNTDAGTKGEYANASSRIVSVYFDSLGPLDTYHTRLAKDEGAKLVRIRWYGDQDPISADAEAGAQVFVECKTHREGGDEPSTKDRAPLPLAQLPAFLANQPLPGLTTDLRADATKREQKRARLLLQMQHHLAGHSTEEPTGPPMGRGTRQQQEPVLRTEYHRAAFQLSDNNDVRVSIDMKMVLACELEGRQGSQVSAWCRSPLASGAAVPPGPTAVRFPYAVLEVKLEDRGNQPAWVSDLLGMGLVHEAGSFSKYIHGCVELFPSLVRAHPFWCLPAFPSHIKAEQQHAKLRIATPQEMSALVALEKAKKEAITAQQQQHLVTPSFDVAPPQQNLQQQQQQLLQSLMSLLLQQPGTVGLGTYGATLSSRDHYGGVGAPSLGVTSGGFNSPRESQQQQQQQQQEWGRPGTDLVLTVNCRDDAGKPGLETSGNVRSGGWRLLRTSSCCEKGQAAPGMPAPGKVNKRGDAKTLFSAERTFLNWMSISALVMLTALSLMSVTDCPTTSWVRGWCPSAIGGAAIAPVGLILMAYSLAIFRWRSAQILAGNKVRFDDQRGPILLVFILVCVMFAAFGLAMYAGAREAAARMGLSTTP